MNSRIFLRGEFPHQHEMFQKIPIELRWNWNMREPLKADWELSPILRKECQTYFIRVWTRDWAMKVLKKAAMENEGFISHGGISYQVIFGTPNLDFHWLNCPEKYTHVKFSFRSHAKGNFVIVRPTVKNEEN